MNTGTGTGTDITRAVIMKKTFVWFAVRVMVNISVLNVLEHSTKDI